MVFRFLDVDQCGHHGHLLISLSRGALHVDALLLGGPLFIVHALLARVFDTLPWISSWIDWKLVLPQAAIVAKTTMGWFGVGLAYLRWYEIHFITALKGHQERLSTETLTGPFSGLVGDFCKGCVVRIRPTIPPEWHGGILIGAKGCTGSESSWT